MRNLMLSTAMVLPLMMAPAMAQDSTAPATGGSATDATTAPMGADTTAAEVPPSMNTEEAADQADGADQAAAEAEVAASGMVEQQQAENELRIDWITDATVNATDGTAIGEINDVIVDAEAGTMKAAVIGVGGFLGIGEKQIAVPWDQLQINYDAQEVTSELTKEQAEAAPEYVYRDQEEAPAEAGETAGSTDGTMTTAPMPGAPVTAPDAAATTPTATPDSAAATTSDPAMATTGAPAPADTAETPATEPAGSGMTAPAEGGTTAPAN